MSAELRDLAPQLALLGVTSAALFGSVARGDADPDSDIDIAVTLADDGDLFIVDDAGRLFASVFGRGVDVARLPLSPQLAAIVDDDLIPVFQL